jgi:hypothetical protein
MAGEISYVNIRRDGISYYEDLLEEIQQNSPAIEWIVIATYKEFSVGIINHFIAKREKGKMGFYLRVYKASGNNDLKYKDHYVSDDYIPEENLLIDMLTSGIV